MIEKNCKGGKCVCTTTGCPIGQCQYVKGTGSVIGFEGVTPYTVSRIRQMQTRLGVTREVSEEGTVANLNEAVLSLCRGIESILDRAAGNQEAALTSQTAKDAEWLPLRDWIKTWDGMPIPTEFARIIYAGWKAQSGIDYTFEEFLAKYENKFLRWDSIKSCYNHERGRPAIKAALAEYRALLQVSNGSGKDAALEDAARICDEIAKGFAVYRDHWPHRDGATECAKAIRAATPASKEGETNV